MKKYEWLKLVVVVQAIAMIALTGFVIIKWWPQPSEERSEQPSQTDNVEQGLLPEDKTDIVASIGNEKISREQLTKELYAHHGDTVLRSMMVQKALELEAQAQGIMVTEQEMKEELQSWIADYDSEEQFYTIMREQLSMDKQQVRDEVKSKLLLDKITMSMVNISNSQIEEYIANHPEQFLPEVLLHMRWIVTETKQKSDQLLLELEQGADFAQLARQYSVDPFTANDGGDMGKIAVDDPFYDKKLLARTDGMQPGQITGPIEIDQGHAIVQLLGKEVTESLSLEKQREEAHKQLALMAAMSQQQVEDELLKKYDALITK
ncbi:peptidylprolyl isomerase [Paenibacillus yanchengensis]|uniref:peptidylprolyl isomerase n=1 Tax=Paenibacillus yanchengensis TaxID=2035833 RepID=A0ABW4YIB0_9BACL